MVASTANFPEMAALDGQSVLLRTSKPWPAIRVANKIARGENNNIAAI